MVILMKRNCPRRHVGEVLRLIDSRGLRPRMISPGRETVVGVVEDLDEKLRDHLVAQISEMPGVCGIETFGSSWKLASRDYVEERTRIRIGDRSIGGGELAIIAGPCAVESREAIVRTAEAVREAGAHILRGGAFKPRTSPYSFRGLGKEGLEYLREASRITGLPVVTEVLAPEDVDLVSSYAQVLQIGARNMQNYALLEAVGEADRPVLLKRGMTATVKELLLAAEYILAGGNSRVMLCERGIRTFETGTRNTMDVSAIPLLRSLSHLPVIADPSHATGRRELVVPVAAAAVAAGVDGLMIEVHHRPEEALSDGRQSLTPHEFASLVDISGRIRDAASPILERTT